MAKTLDDTGIAYAKYVALLVSMRDAPSVTMQNGELAGTGTNGRPGRGVAKRFLRDCEEYRRKAGIDLATADVPYYKPLLAVALGYADVCAITLLSDLDDPFLGITSKVGLPIQRATLAFCPTLESLGVKGKTAPGTTVSPFIEMDEVVSAYADTAQPQPSGLFTNLPLLVITRFKLGSLAVLGRGLTFQRAVFRAMADKVIHVQTTLRGDPPPQTSNETPRDKHWRNTKVSTLRALELDDRSISSFRCAFFDPQDNDVGVVVLCNNYAVAGAINCALQGITFSNLVDHLPTDASVPSTNSDDARKTFEQLNAYLPDATVSWRNLLFQGFDGNHVFATSYSIPCMRFEDFEQPNPERLRGFVELDHRLLINPGHEKWVDDKLREAIPDKPEPPTHLDDAGIQEFEPRFYRVLLGPYDFTCSLGIHVADRRYAVVPLSRAVEHLSKLLGELRRRAPNSAPETETGVAAVCSRLSVSIPYYLLAEVQKPHQSIMSILNRFSRTIVGDDGQDETEPKEAVGAGDETIDHQTAAEVDDEEFARPLSIRRLLRAAEQLCLPAPLRRGLRYLYQNFRSCLGDNIVLDSVLDLYDAFLALEDILEGMAVEHRRAIDAHDWESNRPTVPLAVEHRKVEAIANVVDALQNAMAHRINLHPTQEAIDRAVDLRGGLTKLVSAMDVPLKCGVGVLKRWYRKRTPSKFVTSTPDTGGLAGAAYPPRFLEAAGITRFGFGLGATIALMLQEKAEAAAGASAAPPDRRLVSLALVDMNVANLFHPEDSITYIHEAAHQIYAILSRDGVSSTPRTALTPMGHDDTLTEVFAGFVTHLFVFGCDWELFAKLFVCQYNSESRSLLGPANRSPWYARTRYEFLRVLARGFFITHPFRRLSAQPGPDAPMRPQMDQLRSAMPWRQPSDGGDSTPSASLTAEFLSFVKSFGPFFSEHYRLCVAFGGEFESDAKSVFASECHSSWNRLPGLWETAREIYCGYAENVAPWSTTASHREFHAWVEREFEATRVPDFERCLRAFPLGQGDELKLREFVLLCEVIYFYVKKSYGEMEVQRPLHRPRNLAGSYAISPNKYVLDRGSVGLICPDPVELVKHMQSKVLVLKCFWDLSTRQRARRFVRMLQAAHRSVERQEKPTVDREHDRA